jgi:hypothetical protein
MNLIGTSVPAPASPRGFWMHTYFELQDHYLVAKCYLVAIDTPVFFELKLDVTPALAALRQGHSWLHNQVAGEGVPVNLIGAKSALVEHVANAAQAITRQVSNQVAQQQPTAAHAAYAAADSLLASVERKNLIQNAAQVTKRQGRVSEEVQRALPALQRAAIDGKVAGEVIRTVIGASGNNIQAQTTQHILSAVHENRNYLRKLGEQGVSTGRVVDEQGNIRSRIQMPIPSVKHSVPQLASSVAGHATIVGATSCIGCY